MNNISPHPCEWLFLPLRSPLASYHFEEAKNADCTMKFGHLFVAGIESIPGLCILATVIDGLVILILYAYRKSQEAASQQIINSHNVEASGEISPDPMNQYSEKDIQIWCSDEGIINLSKGIPLSNPLRKWSSYEALGDELSIDSRGHKVLVIIEMVSDRLYEDRDFTTAFKRISKEVTVVHCFAVGGGYIFNEHELSGRFGNFQVDCSFLLAHIKYRSPVGQKNQNGNGPLVKPIKELVKKILEIKNSNTHKENGSVIYNVTSE